VRSSVIFVKLAEDQVGQYDVVRSWLPRLVALAFIRC